MSHTYQQPGTYRVTVSGTGSLGDTPCSNAGDLVAVYVVHLVKPVIAVTTKQKTATNETFTFDASRSQGSELVTSYRWNLDGVTASGASTTMEFPRPKGHDRPLQASVTLETPFGAVDGSTEFTVSAAANSSVAHAGSASSSNSPSTLATTITPPSIAFSSASRTLVNMLIVGLAILLITFPAELFNSTLEENYDDLRASWARRFPRAAIRRQRNGDRRPRQAAAAFAVVMLVGGLLGALLSPSFGFNRGSAESYIATVLAFLLGVALFGAMGYTYRRVRGRAVTPRLHALPAGLAIAGACVLISRLTTFEPGYLYGLICGVAFTSALSEHEEAHVVALGCLATLAVAVTAWFVWVPVSHSANHASAGFAIVTLDDFLASLLVGGLVGTVIGLIPLKFMPGHAIAHWNRWVWAFIFGVAAFGVVQLLLRPVAGPAHPGNAPIVTVVVLFVVFGAISVGFYQYCARRKRRANQDVVGG